MAFKFRRTLKIAPGLRLNLTHRGVSARVGPKGAGYTVNANGQQHISAGVPGSGIHVSKQVAPARTRKKRTAEREEPTSETSSIRHLLKMGALMAVGGLVAIIAVATLT